MPPTFLYLQHDSISADTYERTLQMEQRIEMMKKMKQGPGNDSKQEPEAKNRDSSEEIKLDIGNINNGDVTDATEISQLNQYTFTPSSRGKQHTVEEIAENVNKNIAGYIPDIYEKEAVAGNIEP